MTYVYTVVALCIIDGIWLFSMGGLYKKWLSHLFAPSMMYWPAVIFYAFYAFGLVYFVINPAVASGAGLLTIFLKGAFLGLLAYGAYDLTNQATMRDWPWHVTVIDMAWGALLSGIVSGIVTLLARTS